MFDNNKISLTVQIASQQCKDVKRLTTNYFYHTWVIFSCHSVLLFLFFFVLAKTKMSTLGWTHKALKTRRWRWAVNGNDHTISHCQLALASIDKGGYAHSGNDHWPFMSKMACTASQSIASSPLPWTLTKLDMFEIISQKSTVLTHLSQFDV